MRALIDTQVLLWYIADDPRLSRTARDLFEDEQSELLFSVASAWEILIKAQKGKLKLPQPPPQFVLRNVRALGLRILPLRLRHVFALHGMPVHHRDPFDRLLIAQSQSESIPLLTSDRLIRQYPVQTVW